MLDPSQPPMSLAFEDTFLEHHLHAIGGDQPLTSFELNGLNSLLGGVFPGRMIVIAAPPGSGKTTLLLQIADDLCSKDRRVIFVTAEMPTHRLVEKSISRLAGGKLPVSDVPFAASNPNSDANLVYSRAVNAYRSIASNLLFTENPSIVEIENLVTKNEGHCHQSPIIMVDYVQLAAVMSNNRSSDERFLITQYVAGLSEISRKHGSAVFALSTMGRDACSSSNPNLKSCGGSATIEYGFDSVIFLTASKESDNGTRPTKITAIAKKNRYGSPGKAEFLFNGASATFEDLPQKVIDMS